MIDNASKKPWNWIRTNIIEPESRLKIINILYSVFAMLMLMHHVYITTVFPMHYNLTSITPIPGCIFGIISIILGRMWKDKGFIIFALLGLFLNVRIAVVNGEVFSGTLLSCFYAFGGCYSVARALKADIRKKFLFVFCLLWTAAMIVYSCLAIYVAWTGNAIFNNGGGSFRIYNGDFYPIYHMVHAGILASISLGFALAGFCMSESRACKVYFGIGMLFIFILGILTTRRLNHIINAFILSGFLCIILHKRLRFSKKYLNIICLLGTGVVVFAGLVFVQGRCIYLFNYIHGIKGTAFVSTAIAESAEKIAPRNINLGGGLDSFLNGRINIWRSLFGTIKENPSMLLWGEATISPMAKVNAYRMAHGLEVVSHTHNTWLQFLLEDGLPGFLLYLSFTLYLLKHSIQVIANRNGAIWQRLLPLLVIGCMMADLIDITCDAYTGHPQVTLMYLFAGYVVVFSNGIKKKEINNSQTSQQEKELLIQS